MATVTQFSCELNPESPEAVALALMLKIGDVDQPAPEAKNKDYWLKLYVECLAVVKPPTRLEEIAGRIAAAREKGPPKDKVKGKRK